MYSETPNSRDSGRRSPPPQPPLGRRTAAATTTASATSGENRQAEQAKRQQKKHAGRVIYELLLGASVSCWVGSWAKKQNKDTVAEAKNLALEVKMSVVTSFIGREN
ncbi:hypothetical protein AKJ16_DCAP17802 [Drosera capensis]